jgi:hypothetical protein
VKLAGAIMGVFKRFADLFGRELAKKWESRISISVDSNDELAVIVRKMFSLIEKDETILIVIDDSPCYNRNDLVVFTNKRIYWNLKSAYLNVTSGATRNVTSGPYHIDLAQLSDASIFTRENSRATTIYAVSKAVQMEIPLNHKIYGDIMGLYFSEKLLNCKVGYSANGKNNAALFKEFVVKRRKNTVKEITPGRVAATVLGGANFIFHILLLAAAIAGLFSAELRVPKPHVFFFALLFCLANALFGRKSSASLLFLLIPIVCVIFSIGFLAEAFDLNKLLLIYSILALLLSIADFDKIFKQVTGFFAVCAVIYMFVRFFVT